MTHMKDREDGDIYCQKGGQTISTNSPYSGLAIPQRCDFGFGLHPCSICDAPRCLNRGCKETKQVICEECWPAYVSDMLQKEMYSGDTASTSPDGGSFGGSFGAEDQGESLSPAVDSLQMSTQQDSSSPDSMVEITQVSEDRTEIDITDPIVFKSSKLCIVREGAADDEDSAAEDFMASMADSPNLSTGSVGSAERSNKRASAIFFPGPLGIDFLKDMVTHVHEGTQADQLGVIVGWKLRKINGQKCTSFRDRRMKDARKGYVPYELTFSTRICDEDLAQLALALDESKDADIDVFERPETHVDTTSCSEAPPENAVLSLSFLEATLQEQQDEAEAALAAVEEKASIASARMSEMARRNSQEVPEVASREEETIEIPKKPEGTVASASSSLEDVKTESVACEQPVSFSNSCDQLNDIQRERDQVESDLADLIGDEETLRSKIAELKADVEVVSEGKALACAALASVQEREHLARSRIVSLEARIRAKEKELESNKRSAEKMIKQMQRQNQKRKDIQIEFEETAYDARSNPSLSSSFTCLSSSFSELCRTSQGQDRKCKSWIECLFYIPKVASI